VVASVLRFFIFLFKSNNGVWSPTDSTRHVGHQLAYCTCPGLLWGWRIWWNDDWQGKPKVLEKTCSSATLSTTNPTWIYRARTRAAAVGSQRITAWGMARPFSEFNLILTFLDASHGKQIMIYDWSFDYSLLVIHQQYKFNRVETEGCDRVNLTEKISDSNFELPTAILTSSSSVFRYLKQISIIGPRPHPSMNYIN
jgi:hypothetical protein